MRKVVWRLIVRAMFREVMRLMQNTSGELKVPEAGAKIHSEK